VIVNATCALLTAGQQLLHIHEQVSLQDVLAFFVFLCRLICLVVFPTKSSTTFAAIDVPHGVITRGHRAVVGLPLDDVDNYVKKVSSSMLTVESSRNHRMDGCKVSLARRTTINAFTIEVSAIAHAHSAE